MKNKTAKQMGKDYAGLQSRLAEVEKALENAKDKSQTLSDDRKRALGVIFKLKAETTKLTKALEKIKNEDFGFCDSDLIRAEIKKVATEALSTQPACKTCNDGAIIFVDSIFKKFGQRCPACQPAKGVEDE